MESAEKHRVAAGGALAVDREGFARYITEKLEAEPNIEIVRAEATDIPDGEVVIATGPLTSDAMAERIKSLCPEFDLHFRRAHRHARERGHDQRLPRQPIRQGHGGLHKLPHDPRGVHRLRRRAARGEGGSRARL